LQKNGSRLPTTARTRTLTVSTAPGWKYWPKVRISPYVPVSFVASSMAITASSALPGA
jgi:hypothetical protein